MRKSLIVTSVMSLAFSAALASASVPATESYSGYVSMVDTVEKTITINSTTTEPKTFKLAPMATISTQSGKAVDIANIKTGTFVKMKKYPDAPAASSAKTGLTSPTQSFASDAK